MAWTLEDREDPNVDLVRFPSREGVEEHVDDEVDAISVSVSGSGVDGEEHGLEAGSLVFVPRGARRSTRSVSGGFALTVHRRWGPPRIGRRARPGTKGRGQV